MNKLFLAAAFGLIATAASADPIEGTWKTQSDAGSYAHVRISACGNAYCGKITRTFKSSGEYKSPNIGMRIVRNMSAQGGGKYKGKVIRPADGKTYNGKATVTGNSMKLAGCVAGGLICKSQTWKRVK